VAERNRKFPSKFEIYEVEGNPTDSRLSASIFVLLLIIPVVATILYGGVDIISSGLLAIAGAVVFCLWVIESWKTGEFRFNSGRTQLPIIVLILLGVFQLLPFGGADVNAGALNIEPTNALSLDAFSTRLFVVRTICYLIFFASALVFIDTQKRVRIATSAIVIFGSLIAFFGILQRLANPEAIYGMRPTPQAIPFGPFVNQHHFAGFMEITSGLVFGMLLGGGLKRDRKAFLLIAAVLMATALVFTGSRGGLLSFAGVFVFAVAASYLLRAVNQKDRKADASQPTRKFTAVAAGTGLTLLIVGLVFYLGGGDSMLRGLGFQQMQTDVTSGRIHYWQVALEIFKANPIIGAGLDAFGNAFTRYDTLNGIYRIEQAHNDYLQMLADGGVIGLGCVLAFTFLIFRSGIRNITSLGDELDRGIAIGALAGCFGIAIHSFFDFPLRTPSNALFFLLLIVLATGRSSGKKGLV
jgi:O-antigen ligase